MEPEWAGAFFLEEIFSFFQMITQISTGLFRLEGNLSVGITEMNRCEWFVNETVTHLLFETDWLCTWV